MPTLSSFISYTRPKRKTKAPIQVSSPFPVQNYASSSPFHPYASPPIIDINDGRGPALSPNVPEPSPTPYYNLTNTPKLNLNVEINPEPLTDWFPTNIFKSDPFTLTLDGETTGASGSGTYYGAGYDLSSAVRTNGNKPEETKGEEQSVEDGADDEEEIRTLNSAEDVLANLEAMDVR